MNERDRLVKIMESEGMSARQFSQEIGISAGAISNIMSGRNKSTTVSTVKKICDGIEISVIDFFSSDIFRDLEQEIK